MLSGQTTKIRFEIKNNVSNRCYIYKLGFLYPILILNKRQFEDALPILANHFGRCNKPYHFTTFSGELTYRILYDTPEYKNYYRWYAGPRLWQYHDKICRSDFWVVFKSERDRTLATLILT